MRRIGSFALAFLVAASGFAAALKVQSSSISKGRLSFDERAVIFGYRGKQQRFPFPSIEGGFPRKAPTLGIPGLSVVSFEQRSILPSSGTPRDVSVLVLAGSDGTKIRLVRGEMLEVYRTELVFEDGERLVLWKLASEVQ